jgi:hypothetical protein
MTDEIADAALDMRLRSADPLPQDSLPTEAETEAMLRRLLATGPAGARGAPGPSPRRRLGLARRRLLASATLSAGGLAAGVVLLIGVTATSPAFAVTRNRDGTVTVSLERLSGISGANQRLAAMGVRAKIVKLADEARQVATMHLCPAKTPGWSRTVTIRPSAIPPRQVLLLTADQTVHLRAYAAAYAAAVKFRDAAHNQRLAPADSGNSGAGNSGTGNSATGDTGTGNTGTGNTGPGNTGPGNAPTSVAPGTVRVVCAAPVGWLSPAGGGNSGNSGNTGNG